MKIPPILARATAVLVLLGTLVGTTPSLLLARAAPAGQQGTESWGIGSNPAPQRVQVVMSSEPPASARKLTDASQSSAPFGRFPGPVTPDGEVTNTEPQPWIRPASSSPRQLLAAEDFIIYYNSSLADGPNLSQVASPSVANNAEDIFITYNIYAGLSTDYGQTWSYIDPAVAFPYPPLYGGLTTHQDTIYDPSRDIMLWLMRYEPDTTGNALRLAVAVGESNLESGTWEFYNFLPESYCGTADDDWFDFPHLALTDNYLYLGANVYSAASAFKCTTMIRISLDDLEAGNELSNPFVSSTLFNFTAAHGGTDTFYFARHEDTTHLRVYTWPEIVSSDGVTSTLVEHLAYLTGVYDCTVTGTGGRNPCASDDDRVAAGWLRTSGLTDELGFMWDARQGTPPPGGQNYPYPYTHVLTMDPTTKTVVTDTKVWAADSAWFMPSAGVNTLGDVGGTIARAGGSNPPNCDAWIYDEYTGASFVLDNEGVTPGTGVPDADEWGASLRTRPDSGHPRRWLGTCYSIEGTDVVVPRVVRFGREGPTFSISGNAGTAGAVLTYDDYGAQTATAEPDGSYSLKVSPGWSGTVTPILPHYFFNPESRDYVNVTADQGDQDYDAFLTVHFAPDDGATVCRTPYVIVKIFLSDLTRDGDGYFNQSTVTFTLDGGNILSLSSIRVPLTMPNVWAHLMYRPSSNLALGDHTAEFTHPEASGTVTDTWTFTAADQTCDPPLLLSALTEHTVELQQAPAAPVTVDASRRSLISPVGSSGESDTGGQQVDTEVASSSNPRRDRNTERPERNAPQGSPFAPPLGSSQSPQPSSPLAVPALSAHGIGWNGWTAEFARPFLVDYKRR